ncbi:unnamed protein product [Ectocarpus sp. 13 AM-2016]
MNIPYPDRHRSNTSLCTVIISLESCSKHASFGMALDLSRYRAYMICTLYSRGNIIAHQQLVHKHAGIPKTAVDNWWSTLWALCTTVVNHVLRITQGRIHSMLPQGTHTLTSSMCS